MPNTDKRLLGLLTFVFIQIIVGPCRFFPLHLWLTHETKSFLTANNGSFAFIFDGSGINATLLKELPIAWFEPHTWNVYATQYLKYLIVLIDQYFCLRRWISLNYALDLVLNVFESRLKKIILTLEKQKQNWRFCDLHFFLFKNLKNALSFVLCSLFHL